ncbi:MAG: DNA repair protein RecN [Acidobacteriota bacterium]|nr:DNA repair protein RecN [Acidobacteriota bacterium]
MLREIHIQNYAVIDTLAVEFGPGLNLLSGETGSGKSILVDALGLALGGRTSAEVIRTGEDRAMVTAVFSAEGKALWAGWLEEFGVAGDEGELILRRELQTGGRSRMLVNDQPVTLAAVRQLSRRLVEMHGQNEHVSLFARDAQLGLLDQFAGVSADLESVRALHGQRLKLEQELEGLSHNEQERLRTIDLLGFQARELKQADLQPGEDAQLEEERTVLSNLEKIRAAATSAFDELYESEGAAISRVAAAARYLDELRRYDPAVAPEVEPLAAARATLEDVAAFLRTYVGKLEANPVRLEEIEDRLALIDRMKRKYGNSLEAILEYAAEVRQNLASLEHADERREAVRKELAKAAADYRKAAESLSAKRRDAARRLVKLVREELAQLGMEKTRMEIGFESAADGQGSATGIDEIEFRISPNVGEELRAMEKIASGGEISRLMLALKTVVGQARVGRNARGTRNSDATFIFDEIDAGIGGRVAECVGQRLKRLARDAQVLCVTHLAQIACFADSHFYVEKSARANRTVTTVKPLAGDKERAEELARMLSGSQITDAILKHAATMLRQAGS